jgi:hypothetical protein
MQLSVLGFGCGAVGGLMVRGDPLDQERTIARAVRAPFPLDGHLIYIMSIHFTMRGRRLS